METHLPDFVLARLYKDSLVVPDKSTTLSPKLVPKGTKINLPNTTNSTDKSTPDKKWWLGENSRKIAILVEDSDHVFMGDKELEFLSNILSACKLNLSNVAIINYAKTPVGYTEIVTEPGCDRLLLFGVMPQQLQLQFNFPYYQPQPYDNCTFVLSQPLRQMMQNTTAAKEEKKKLWISLQALFSL